MKKVQYTKLEAKSLLTLAAGFVFASVTLAAAYLGISRTLQEYPISFLIALSLSLFVFALFHSAAMNFNAQSNSRR